MQLYVYLNGARRGPFSEEQVRSFMRDGLLLPLDLASHQADGNLQPISAFEIFRATSTPLLEVPLPTPPAISQAPPVPVEKPEPAARSPLAPNETPSYRTSLHWIVFLRFALLALCVFLLIAMPFGIAVQAVTGSQLGWFALPLPAFIMLTPTLAYLSSELVITNVRVLIKTGILRRQTLEMFISKIESIAVDQSFLGRLFDYGTVVIRGTGGFEERFQTIAHPREFRNWVQRMQKNEAAPVR
jgi:hypothetical protein